MRMAFQKVDGPFCSAAPAPLKTRYCADTTDCPGTPVEIANLQPVGGSGGFAELSFPLSRIFHANAEGPNSGWVFHMG